MYATSHLDNNIRKSFPAPRDRHFIPPVRLLTPRYAFYLSVNVIVGLCSDSVVRLD